MDGTSVRKDKMRNTAKFQSGVLERTTENFEIPQTKEYRDFNFLVNDEMHNLER
jgi:hypothetical protein